MTIINRFVISSIFQIKSLKISYIYKYTNISVSKFLENKTVKFQIRLLFRSEFKLLISKTVQSY